MISKWIQLLYPWHRTSPCWADRVNYIEAKGVLLKHKFSPQKVVVQSLSHVWLFGTPWTTACQAPLSSTISQSLHKFMSIELIMPSNHLIFCYSLLLPALSLSQHQGLFQWVSSSNQVAKVSVFKVSASASVLPMNIQGWFPLGLTGLISLQSIYYIIMYDMSIYYSAV